MLLQNTLDFLLVSSIGIKTSVTHRIKILSLVYYHSRIYLTVSLIKYTESFYLHHYYYYCLLLFIITVSNVCYFVACCILKNVKQIS